MLKILIISSCTKKKEYKGFDENKIPRTIEQLNLYMKDSKLVNTYGSLARDLYLGKGHKYVKEAIQIFKSKKVDVDWMILSAGYGLISNNKLCIPYDITFNGQTHEQIIESSNKLNIPSNIEKAINDHDVIIFLLPSLYLKSIQFDKLSKKLKDKNLVFVDSKSSLKMNRREYESLSKQNYNVWFVRNWKKYGGNRYFRGWIIKNDIASKVSSINELVKNYAKDLEFN